MQINPIFQIRIAWFDRVVEIERVDSPHKYEDVSINRLCALHNLAVQRGIDESMRDGDYEIYDIYDIYHGQRRE